MASAGYGITALLRSDGSVTVVGDNKKGACNVPEPPEGLWYTQVSAGCNTVCLRSDGQAILTGRDFTELPSHWAGFALAGAGAKIPELPPGLVYTQVSSGARHIVLLRSDAQVFAIGDNFHGQCKIPVPPQGVTYTQVSAGEIHTGLLRSDGRAVAVGINMCGQCKIPGPPAGTEYTQISAGDLHTVLLRSDGGVTVVGDAVEAYPGYGGIPPLPGGIVYTQVSAGLFNDTALLRSDGIAVTVCADHPEVQIPPPPEGVVYECVSTRLGIAVALRSDGVATTIQFPTDDVDDDERLARRMCQCDLPVPPPGVAYSTRTSASDFVQWIKMVLGDSKFFDQACRAYFLQSKNLYQYGVLQWSELFRLCSELSKVLGTRPPKEDRLRAAVAKCAGNKSGWLSQAEFPKFFGLLLRANLAELQRERVASAGEQVTKSE